MDDYKPNSYKTRELSRKDISKDHKKVSKIVTGLVKTKKKSDARKIADVFIPDDISKVKEYVVLDVLIPTLKKTISEIVREGIDMILYGEAGRTRKSDVPASRISHTNYNSISNNDRRSYRSTTSRSTYSYDELVLETRGEAEAVMMQMDEIIASYGFARVGDLYDLVGVTGDYTSEDYGWSDIRSASIVRLRDGYHLKFPRAMPID